MRKLMLIIGIAMILVLGTVVISFFLSASIREKLMPVEALRNGVQERQGPGEQELKQEESETPETVTPITPEETEQVKATLVNFFDLLSSKEYEKALALFGMENAGESWNIAESFTPPAERNDKVKVLKNYCEAVETCLKADIKEIKKTASDEYLLGVQLTKGDGTIYTLGPCCGETEETMPPTDIFGFTVKKINGEYKVTTAPAYHP